MLLRGEKVKCKVVTLKFGEKRWECLDEGSPDPVKGARNQIRRRAKTKTEAKQKVQNKINLLESEGLISSKKRKKTFDEVAHEWIQAYGAAGKKRGSVRIREKDLNVLFKHIAKVPIEKK